ncbi:MAG: hypothetical protein H7210_11185, partial [Pyrinomonadaceae bacterium]|nr:hypothetical protein [Phycisphaerales bacterium]
MKFHRCLLFGLVGLAAPFSRAQIDIPWTNGAGGNWSMAANWDMGNVPDQAGERALLNLDGMYTVSVNQNVTVGGILSSNPMATISLNNGRTLTLQAADPMIDHAGPFIVNSMGGGSATFIHFTSSGTLSGSGSLILNANPNLDTAYLNSNIGAAITNQVGHLIRGTGNIYGTLINNGAVTADVNTRTLQLLSAGKTNNGLLSSSGGGTLQLNGFTLTQEPDAVIRAGHASLVNLVGATIVGGDIDSQGSGIVRVISGATTLSGVNTISGNLHILNGNTLFLNASPINHGVITVNSVAGGIATIIQCNVSGGFGGAGSVLLNANLTLDTAQLRTGPGAAMTNGPGHLIHGTGNIHAALVNEGVVSADVPDRILQLLGVGKTNNSLIQAVNGSTLQLSGTTFTQGSLGRLLADGGQINLNGATITGGEINTLGGRAQVIGTSTINGLASFIGTLNINNGQTLIVNGDLPNSGALTVNPSGGMSATVIRCNSDAEFSGSGQIVLNANVNLDAAQLQSGNGAVMTNGVDHLIRGAGRINALLTNQGEIRADRDGLVLELTGNDKTNNSILAAIDGGILQISGIQLLQGPAGRLTANDATMNFSIADIVGGMIETINGGLAQVTGTSTFSSVASLVGSLNVNNNVALIVNGGLPNNGTIIVNPSSGGSITSIQSNITGEFSGTGQIVLNANANLDSAYLQTGPDAAMTNGAHHLIRGTGRIHALLVNEGEIRADVSGRFLELTGNGKVNNNLIAAVKGSTLQMTGTTLTQGASGRVIADGATVNLANTTIAGGTIQTTNAGTVNFTAGTTFD